MYGGHKRHLHGARTMKMMMSEAVTIKTSDPGHIYRCSKNDRLGKGAFGEVYKCRSKKNGKTFAMKVSKEESLKIIDREIRMHALSDGHKNIVGFQDAFLYRKKVFLILEFMNAGSLFDYIYDLPVKVRFREKAIAYFTKAMLTGLSYMHSKHHLHRDIKSQNILLNSHGDVKIADFGFAVGLTKQAEKRRTVLGSPFWMAPELIAKKPYDGKVDVWATAITSYEAAESQPPHIGAKAAQVMFLIKSQPSPSLTDRSHWSNKFIHFMRRGLTKDPDKRPSSAELLMHPFLETEMLAKRSHFVNMMVQINNLKKKGKNQ